MSTPEIPCAQPAPVHTPGPWTVSELDARGDPSAFHIFIEPGVAVIERKVAGSDQCDMPDAHLIAAAPELLEALTLLADKADELVTHLQATGRLRPCFNLPAIQAARAAITKATGAQA